MLKAQRNEAEAERDRLEAENAALRKALDDERKISTGLLNLYTDANSRAHAIAQTDERKAETK